MKMYYHGIIKVWIIISPSLILETINDVFVACCNLFLINLNSNFKR